MNNLHRCYCSKPTTHCNKSCRKPYNSYQTSGESIYHACISTYQCVLHIEFAVLASAHSKRKIGFKNLNWVICPWPRPFSNSTWYGDIKREAEVENLVVLRLWSFKVIDNVIIW